MKLPVYKLDINEWDEETGIDFVSLVESPAIQKDFLAFNQEFVEPNPNEGESDFISRCVSVLINEGKSNEEAVAICYSYWQQKFAKISYDWDGVGSTADGKKAIEQSIANGDEVYIISARSSKENINMDIPSDHIFAVGSNKAKIEKIKELGISKHYDNNPDVVNELGSKGQKFAAYQFAIQDEEKRIVTGAAMIADLPIYRRDDMRGEYYVVFDKESIFKIAKKWARSNKYDAVNTHHRTPIMDGVSLFESYIIDRERGVMPPKGFEEVADGSWFVSYLVDNDDVWARVKDGEFKGFSVEGVFDFPEDKEEQTLEQLKKVIAQWDGK